MITRRDFIKLGGASAAAVLLSSKFGFIQKAFAEYVANNTLDPTSITKFTMPLVKPPAMPGKYKGPKHQFDIAMRQFQQQILPSSYPKTTVWSYGPTKDPRTVEEGGAYFYPAFTIESEWNKPTQVKWVNDLQDSKGNFLPHLLPVDPSLHWANPIGRRDTRPNAIDDPDYWSRNYIDSNGNYSGPVPMVTHVHGAHVSEESDGYPEAWYLPNARKLPGLHRTGTFYDYYNTKYAQGWSSGSATFTYPNDQPATTLWYHDHTLGMTRVNVYAGPAGFWLIRGGPGDMVTDMDGNPAILPGPAPGVGDNPFGTYYEIPIAFQDRSFKVDGSLFYPDIRAFFEDLEPEQLQIPFTFDQLGINPDANGWGLGCDGTVSDVAPIWNPEFFGNTMVVNGQTWPYLDVERRRYRFRLLNGCNSRFLILQFSDPNVEVYQIGAEQGFLPEPVLMNENLYPGADETKGATILMAPAERADVIVDFSKVSGSTVTLLNLGPDDPFGGGIIGDDFDAADPGTTGQVMEFRVGKDGVVDPTTPPANLRLPAVALLSPDKYVNVSLNEEESRNITVNEDDEGKLVYACDGEIFGPTAALLGTLVEGVSNPMMWAEAVSENPDLNTTEEWTIYNFTADAHPIHVHLVKFQVVDRQMLKTDDGGEIVFPALVEGPKRPPEPWESGNKDTVIAYPGEVTRIKMKFDLPGFYVWHCHIVEHEDNEMMRPYVVGPQDVNAPHPHA